MTDYSELNRKAQAAIDAIGTLSRARRERNFNDACTPQAVLALIAENEELGRYLCTCRDCGGEGALHTGDWHSYGHMEPPEPVMEKCGECDGTGLLGEIQDLYQVITDRDRLKAENERQAAQFKEWQANHHANYVNAAQERDDLRAEVAVLKTGYEAYERVNAELKAEVEALRKDSESYRLMTMCQDNGARRLVESVHELCAEIRRLKILAGEPVPANPDEFIGPSPEGPTARLRRNMAAMGRGYLS